VLTATQCQSLAHHYKTLSQAPNTSKDRAFMLKNIARSLTGLATQLDRLEANAKDEKLARRLSSPTDL
jgi:hypothetical protein